jgi:hypothetical protein
VKFFVEIVFSQLKIHPRRNRVPLKTHHAMLQVSGTKGVVVHPEFDLRRASAFVCSPRKLCH